MHEMKASIVLSDSTLNSIGYSYICKILACTPNNIYIFHITFLIAINRLKTKTELGLSLSLFTLTLFLYPEWDLNPHRHYCLLDFKSSASTNSAIRAFYYISISLYFCPYHYPDPILLPGGSSHDFSGSVPPSGRFIICQFHSTSALIIIPIQFFCLAGALPISRGRFRHPGVLLYVNFTLLLPLSLSRSNSSAWRELSRFLGVGSAIRAFYYMSISLYFCPYHYPDPILLPGGSSPDFSGSVPPSGRI